MSLFKTVENGQAFLKCGLMGFQGSGKSTTASYIGIGLIKHLREIGSPLANKPTLFLDTENGSDWLKKYFDAENIDLKSAKTRAFKDLIPGIYEAEKNGAVLIIDSITHYWRELTETYRAVKEKKYLTMVDWNFLKGEWYKFADIFVNSNVHIIMCGRAGYEYDHTEDEDGKKEIEKSGIKMKAEGEMGYEPSLSILMQSYQEVDNGKLIEQYRTATILKDRSGTIDGKVFKNPSFNEVLPHIQFLNLGGKQHSIDSNRNSADMFEPTSKDNWQVLKQKKEIALDEIAQVMQKHYPSQSADDKKARQLLLEDVFGTLSWKKIETEFKLSKLEEARNSLWLKLEGSPYSFVAPDNSEVSNEEIEDISMDIPVNINQAA